MILITSVETLRSVVSAARALGHRIGFVPTMGYLHEGHLFLLDEARARSDFVVLSVFVNPLQFGPAEDLAGYPRDIERDTRLAAERGADVLFVPSVEDMYPNGDPAVHVSAPRLADRLCGAFRPGHFQGVLTVVTKLLNIVAPDLAVFGRKDFQQYALVRRMAADLNLPIQIVAAPIVRDPDGLALSSRNVYLSPEERHDALLLSRALAEAQRAFMLGNDDAAELVTLARDVLSRGTLVRVQYLDLVDPDTLDPVLKARAGDVLTVAAFVGSTRLIDNQTLTHNAT